MLIRQRVLALCAGLALGATVVVFAPTVAWADSVHCGPTGCVVNVGDPGGNTGGNPGSGSGSNSGGSGQCNSPGGGTVPCYLPEFGWYDTQDGCYYALRNPQPPAGDPLWRGHAPGDGAVYVATCPGTSGTGGGVTWLASPPPGFGSGAPPAAVLAQQALARMVFPHLGVATAPADHTYVGLATLLWIPPAQWRVLSATAAIGSRSVTVTATPVSVTWDLGEGRVACAGPGTPWDPRAPEQLDTGCSYTYRSSSIHQPGTGNNRAYDVQATVTYSVRWVCSGRCDANAGDLAAQSVPSQVTRLAVWERQSVVVGSS